MHAYARSIVLGAILLPGAELTAQDWFREQEPGRHALVLGNSAYANLDALLSAEEDARQVTTSLQRLGFEVEADHSFRSLTDLTDRILPAFTAKIRDGDLVVVYFSGHGFSYQRNNWLAPLELPTSLSVSELPDRAISIAGIGSMVSTNNPGLVVIVSDACRSIANFIVRDETGQPVTTHPLVEDPEFRRGVAGVILYAARTGQTALAYSEKGKLSRFTESFVKFLPMPGLEFADFWRRVRNGVAIASADAQTPGVNDWSGAEWYFKPTPAILSEQKSLWSALMSVPQDRNAIENFARQYVVSRHRAAAKQWLGLHGGTSYASNFSTFSPMAIDKSFNSIGLHAAVLPNAVGLGYLRTVKPDSTASLSDLTRTELGVVASGTRPARADRAKVAADALSVKSHETVVTAQTFFAKASASASSTTIASIPKNVQLEIQEVKQTATGQWALASRKGEAESFYIALSPTAERIAPLELGRPLLEVVIPPSTTTRGAVNADSIVKSLAIAKRGNTISWVSLATAPNDTAAVSAVRSLQLVHARYLVRNAGVGGTRITAVAGATDMSVPGVRMRVFGF
jgi:hypothetical protein